MMSTARLRAGFFMPAGGKYSAMSDEDYHAMLARIDERLKHLEKVIDDFVTQMEFAPVKLIAFGLAGITLAAVVAALVAQVIK